VADDAVPDWRPPLSGGESRQAEALARYSQFLLLQADQPESPRLPDILRRTVLADPAIPAFQLWLAQSYLLHGRAAEAIPGLEEAIRRYPDSDALLYLLGLAYEGSARISDARKSYRQLLKRNPRQPDAYIRLAGLAIHENKDEAAFALLDEALGAVEDPMSVLLLYDQLGQQYLVSGKPWLAALCFSRVADRQPDNRAVRERLMKSRLVAGDRAGTLRELRALAELDPGASRWPLLLGELAEEQKDAALAAEWYGKATRASDADASAWIRLALCQSRTDPSKAMATLQQAIGKYPGDPQPAIAAGALLFAAERPAEAVAAFDQAEACLMAAAAGKAIGFLSPYFYFWYGAACDQSGQPERAELYLERSISLFPEITEAFNYLAYVWAQKNVNLDKALTYAKQAVAAKPDSAAYLDTLGWVLFRKGDYAGAQAQVRAAAAKAEDSEIAFHMGEILSALGRQDEALAWWRKSVGLDSASPAAGRLMPGAKP
jgi:tetratricopeptide (TPR) repeat protein